MKVDATCSCETSVYYKRTTLQKDGAVVAYSISTYLELRAEYHVNKSQLRSDVTYRCEA